MGPVKKLECLFCWKMCGSKQKEAADEELMTKIFNSCCRHLNTSVLGNSPPWMWTNFKNNKGPFCPSCFQYAKNLSVKNDSLDSIEKEVKCFVTVLTTQILTQRNSIQANTKAKKRVRNTPSAIKKKIKQSVNILLQTTDNCERADKGKVEKELEENDENEEVDDLPHCCEVFNEDEMDHSGMQDEKKSRVIGENASTEANEAKELDVLVQAAAAAECMITLSGENEVEEISVDSDLMEIRKKYKYKPRVPKPESEKTGLERRTDTVMTLGEFLCGTCGLTYVTKYELSRHEKRHILRFKCDECGEQFPSQFKLETHIKRKNDPYDFKCGICGEKYKQEYALKSHKLELGHYTPEEAKDFVGMQEKLQKEQECKRLRKGSKRPPPRVCDECGKSFRCPSHVKYHKIFNHSNEKPFECKECGRKFKLKSQLTTHSLIHSEQTIWRCNDCNKTFTTNFYLQRHLRLNHSSNNYKCDICDYVTLIKESFSAHMIRLHNPEKKFVCEVCGIRLSSKNSLTNHERIHTGEKPCACTECGESFRTNVLLNQHVNVMHKGGFQCHICDYVAGAKFVLDEHLKKHSDERPFRCGEPCPRMFKQKSSLITHLKRGCKYNPSPPEPEFIIV